MPKYSLLKADKMKKMRLSSRKKHSITSWLNSLTDETFVIQNNELVEFAAQFANKLKVSPSLQSTKWKDIKYNKISAGENETEAASNFLEAVQNNMEDLTQRETIMQVSLSSRSKALNNLSSVQRKNIFTKKRRKDDSTLMISTDDEWKTKSLVKNQVGYVYEKFFLFFFISAHKC